MFLLVAASRLWAGYDGQLRMHFRGNAWFAPVCLLWGMSDAPPVDPLLILLSAIRMRALASRVQETKVACNSNARAFCEKVESRWDSRESVFVIQASHWTGGQHEWGSHIRMTCDAVSFKRLRLVIRTRKLRICAA